MIMILGGNFALQTLNGLKTFPCFMQLLNLSDVFFSLISVSLLPRDT